MPKARYSAPPPKSATRFKGGAGGAPGRPIAWRAPVKAMVVEVVPGGLCQRPALAPAGHAAVDEAGVALEADLGAEAEALGDAGTEAFDERVGPGCEVQHQRHALRPLEVDGDGSPAAVQQLVARRLLDAETARRQPLDPAAPRRRDRRAGMAHIGPGPIPASSTTL